MWAGLQAQQLDGRAQVSAISPTVKAAGTSLHSHHVQRPDSCWLQAQPAHLLMLSTIPGPLQAAQGSCGAAAEKAGSRGG